jgi:transcriptional regulator with XRE-family HTH domain
MKAKTAIKTFPHSSSVRKQHADTLGAFVQRSREQHGMSLRKLAQHLSISAGLLSRIERDFAFPSDKVLARIGEAFEVDIAGLKRFDTRVRLYDLRRMIQRCPEFGAAIHALIEQVRQGKSSIEEVTERLHSAGFRHTPQRIGRSG